MSPGVASLRVHGAGRGALSAHPGGPPLSRVRLHPCKGVASNGRLSAPTNAIGGEAPPRRAPAWPRGGSTARVRVLYLHTLADPPN